MSNNSMLMIRNYEIKNHMLLEEPIPYDNQYDDWNLSVYLAVICLFGIAYVYRIIYLKSSFLCCTGF